MASPKTLNQRVVGSSPTGGTWRLRRVLSAAVGTRRKPWASKALCVSWDDWRESADNGCACFCAALAQFVRRGRRPPFECQPPEGGRRCGRNLHPHSVLAGSARGIAGPLVNVAEIQSPRSALGRPSPRYWALSNHHSSIIIQFPPLQSQFAKFHDKPVEKAAGGAILTERWMRYRRMASQRYLPRWSRGPTACEGLLPSSDGRDRLNKASGFSSNRRWLADAAVPYGRGARNAEAPSIALDRPSIRPGVAVAGDRPPHDAHRRHSSVQLTAFSISQSILRPISPPESRSRRGVAAAQHRATARPWFPASVFVISLFSRRR